MTIRVNFLSQSLFAIGGFFPLRKRRLGGEQNVLFGRCIFVGGFFYYFFICVGFIYFSSYSLFYLPDLL